MRRGRISTGRSLLVGSAVCAVALGALWTQRRPIAAGAIDRALAARGVAASYRITDIGFRTQLIEDLRIGDPDRPDLTARWVTLSLVPSWNGVAVKALEARGVRLQGRIVQGHLDWGAVDRLLPKSDGRAFALPAVHVRLTDTRVLLASDVGAFTIDIAGAGGLADGFTGRLRATAPFAGTASCRIQAPVVTADVSIAARRPRLAGDLRASPSTCGAIATGDLRASFDTVLTSALDGWRGRADLAANTLGQGAAEVTRPRGHVVFAGTAASTNGQFSLLAPAARYETTRLAGLSAQGDFAAGTKTAANGRLSVSRAVADPRQIAALRRGLGATSGTPVGPLATSLSAAIGRAGQGMSLDAAFAYAAPVAKLTDMRVRTLDGGELAMRGGSLVIDRSGLVAEGDVTVRGGGFPVVRGRLSRTADGSVRGLFDITPYRAGDAQVTLAPVRLTAGRDGAVQIATTAIIDGPLPGGRLDGLRFPVDVERSPSGSWEIAPGCTPVSYRRLAVAGTVLAPGGAPLCPTRGRSLLRVAGNSYAGGARIGPLQLHGRVGAEPLRLAAASAAIDLGGPLSLTQFVATLGTGDDATSLRVARLGGKMGTHGLSGRFDGLSGNVAAVPFLASGGQGGWSLRNGTLALNGGFMLADRAAQPRFNPLSAQQLSMRLANGKMAARATLVEPVSDRTIASVAITHDLADSTGEARLSVDALTFGKSLQPEAITPLTLGIVADVYGQIDGTGTMRWRGDKVTSTGKFRSDGLDLAAAFGPVSGASGSVEFDDLIALSTPAGQVVKLALVNPGVEARDGVISYRLRPGQVVEIEHGRWPFAGGELMLEPGTLDFGRSRARSLSFRVVALDAGKFIEQLKLENIAATGTFDGVLPIVFDSSGGRIEAGQIVARRGGGTLAYVGDVSNAETNTLAKLAFDALKSIRYRNLAIDLDGALDGEIVSLVRFDGVNQSPVAPSGLAKSFTGLPFRFNIRVRAPFRGLVNTARSYQDPGLLLNRTVQPVASDQRP